MRPTGRVFATLWPMSISVTRPIARAWERMVDLLFTRFDFLLWLGLGFSVFLANLLRRGASFNFRVPTGGGPGQPVPADIWEFVEESIQWVKDHAYWVIGAVLAFYVLSTLIWAAILWVRSRGVFMEIDNLAFGRGRVAEPWREFRGFGNNLFKFDFIAWLLFSVVVNAALVAGGFIAWPDVVAHEVGVRMLWAFILLLVVLPLATVNYLIVQMLLYDFIAPTMYIHGLRVGAAWKLWYHDLLRGHFWVTVLFYLMKLVLAMAVGVATMLAMCLTCCVVLLPYIGTVILLPAYVFMRCYTLYYIEQFGEPWRLFVYEEGAVMCLSCGYDLRGNPGALTCPECGAPTPVGAPAPDAPPL